MKSLWSRILAFAGKLSAVLAACMGCDGGDCRPKKPREPRQIQWKGQDTGYGHTTVVQPAHETADQEHP